MSENGDKIAQAALRWLGTPHINMARVKGRGVDCGMLLIASLEESGVVEKGSIPIKPYSNEWHLHHSEEWFLHYVQTYCDKVSTLETGDFLLYQFGRCISHGGVYVGKNQICHAVIEKGVILSDLNEVMFFDAHGKNRLRAIYRFNPWKYRKEVAHGDISKPHDL